jgi:hypothetical protein
MGGLVALAAALNQHRNTQDQEEGHCFLHDSPRRVFAFSMISLNGLETWPQTKIPSSSIRANPGRRPGPFANLINRILFPRGQGK